MISSRFLAPSLRRFSSTSVLASIALLAGGCVNQSKDTPLDIPQVGPNDLPNTEEEVVEEAIPVRVGRVMAVGESGRFVVVSLDIGAEVSTGDTLKARFAGSQTAVLKVSPERQGRLVTADVVAGTPAKDHEVVK